MDTTASPLLDAAPPTGFDAPDVVHLESGVRAWFASPCAVITQVPRPSRTSPAEGDFYRDILLEALQALPDTQGGQIWIHDWSRVVGYDPVLRARLPQFAFGHRRRLHTIVMVMPEHPDPVPQMGVTMGAAALRLAGINCLVVATLDEAIERTQVRPRDERRAA
jgi:hypothetical protein